MVIVERNFMEQPPVAKVERGLQTDFSDELFAAKP
jgi:hypothetical protein